LDALNNQGLTFSKTFEHHHAGFYAVTRLDRPRLDAAFTVDDEHKRGPLGFPAPPTAG